MLGLTLQSPPAKEPLSVAEAKKQVELAAGVTHHDAYLAGLISAAREAMEVWCKRAWITQTWKLTLDRFPTWEIAVPRPPLQSVTTIQYVDDNGTTQTLDASAYLVALNRKPGRITPAYNTVWPVARNVTEAVTVTYVAGYGDDPSDVPHRARQALRLCVAHWFANREPVGAGTTELPLSARWLLTSLRSRIPGCWD